MPRITLRMAVQTGLVLLLLSAVAFISYCSGEPGNCGGAGPAENKYDLESNSPDKASSDCDTLSGGNCDHPASGANTKNLAGENRDQNSDDGSVDLDEVDVTGKDLESNTRNLAAEALQRIKLARLHERKKLESDKEEHDANKNPDVGDNPDVPPVAGKKRNLDHIPDPRVVDAETMKFIETQVNSEMSMSMNPQVRIVADDEFGFKSNRVKEEGVEGMERQAPAGGQAFKDAAVQGETKQSGQELMHLAVVACGDRLEETLVMIKSAAILSRADLIVHIFADDDLQPQFAKELNTWPQIKERRVQYLLYDIQFPPDQKADDWRKLFKPCATQRLFIPDILKDVERLIYVDTDILFLRPLEDLWAFFERFDERQLAGLAWEHEDGSAGWYNRFARHPYYPPYGVNSGVMHMVLPRMRAANWSSHMKEYYHEYKLRITWGDQDLINIFFHYYPELLYVFGCDWNYRPDHCMYMQNCKQAKTHGISVLHGSRQVYHNDKQITFKAVYDALSEHDVEAEAGTSLVRNIKSNLKETLGSKDRCTGSSDLFTKQLEKQILLRKQDTGQGHTKR